MAQYDFGVGILAFTPPGSNQTPVQCGVLQEVSFNIEQAQVPLRGSQKYPVDVAAGEGNMSGSAKFAIVYGAALQAFLDGSSLATGTTVGAIAETGTIPGTPFGVTVVNSATFVEDLGVTDGNTGLRMTRVASSPATGQYSVAAGVYTFAAADTGHVVLISYSYTLTTGKTVSYSNQLMGQAVTFTMAMYNSYAGKNTGLKLFAVRVPKFDVAMKNSDYRMNSIDFAAFANPAGKILEQYSSE